MSRPSRFPRRTFALLAVASAVVFSGLSHAQTPAKPAAAKAAAPAGPLAGQVVKMVRIDAQTGLLGPVGVSQLCLLYTSDAADE